MTRAGRTPSVPNALEESFERVSDVRLLFVEFCYLFNTPVARFTYTLLCDCCLNVHSSGSDLIIYYICSGRPVTFGVKNIGQVQKYRFFEARNIG